MDETVLSRLIKKASSSSCRTRIGAVALDAQGSILGFSRNSPRFIRKGGGVHAEMVLIRQYRRHIHRILICRVNDNGGLLPIEPCPICHKQASRLGIRIVSVKKPPARSSA